jgi:hypothetical protein
LQEHKLTGRVRNLFKSEKETSSFTFPRPLVIFQSDDWGRVGVRDKEGYEQLRSQGLRLGEHPYDLYTLETADDVGALASLLTRHRDSTGRHPCLVMNFCTANLDFNSMATEQYKAPRFLTLDEGLPGKWSRPRLLEAYRAGIDQGVFYPGLHGVSHFCPLAVGSALKRNEERAEFLRLLWKAETPYIFWRMPWIGYEYWNPEKPSAGFLAASSQEELIKQAIQNFATLFRKSAVSACAPGYRANHNTHRAWSKSGIRVAQSGTSSGLRAPHLDEFGLLHVYRSLDLEPCQRELEMGKYLEIARAAFAQSLPLIISIHAINFHSTLKDFCTPAIAALDALLTALEFQYPNLLYIHDEDLHRIVTAGIYNSPNGEVSITAGRQPWDAHSTPQGVV